MFQVKEEIITNTPIHNTKLSTLMHTYAYTSCVTEVHTYAYTNT